MIDINASLGITLGLTSHQTRAMDEIRQQEDRVAWQIIRGQTQHVVPYTLVNAAGEPKARAYPKDDGTWIVELVGLLDIPVPDETMAERCIWWLNHLQVNCPRMHPRATAAKLGKSRGYVDTVKSKVKKKIKEFVLAVEAADGRKDKK